MGIVAKNDGNSCRTGFGGGALLELGPFRAWIGYRLKPSGKCRAENVRRYVVVTRRQPIQVRPMRRKHAKAESGTPRLTRRNSLQIGGLGMLGLSLPQLFEAQASAATNPGDAPPQRIKSCILIFYYGGPSHLDTFDTKPEAPADIRGEFQSIATSVPGLRIGENLPHTARIMHKVTVVRSMQHQMRGHDSASYHTLTGRVPPVGDNQNFGELPNAFPNYGACLNYVRRKKPNLIPHAALPFVMNNNIINPGQTGGFLGTEYQPLLIQGDPGTLTYSASGALNVLDLPEEVTTRRLDQRRALLRSLEVANRPDDGTRSMRVYYEKAFDLLRSQTLRNALAIDQESPATRKRYGHGPAGQPFDDNPKSKATTELAIGRNLRGFNLLLARRLVEAGVPFVNVYDYKQQGKNWDSHVANFRYLKQYLLPAADQAYAALIEDLDERGLLDTTLVVALGEFGRTPKINDKAGRDHWPNCYSALLAGGGIKGGYIHGASDAFGAYPVTSPVLPGDVGATILTLFGLNPASEAHDPLGRPFLICDGKPVSDLLT